MGRYLWKLEIVFGYTHSWKAHIDYHLDLKAIPEQNDSSRKVYSGRVSYRNVLWNIWGWTPTIVADIVPFKQYDAAHTLLPLETFSGGVNNLQSVASGIDVIDFPSEGFLKPRYGFIPAASALDIRRTNSPLTVHDYRKAYNAYELEDYNLTTAFHNFVTETSTQARDNFGHISFSLKSSSWLVQELIAASNADDSLSSYDCNSMCGMEISGPDAICNAQNTTFSLASMPQGTLYSWSVFGASVVGSTSEGSVVVRANNPNASRGTILVTVRMPDCGMVTLTKDFLIGAPQDITNDMYGTASINVYVSASPGISIPVALLDYSVDPVPNATYYEWELPGYYEEVDVLDVYPTNWQILNSTKHSNEVTVRSNGNTNGEVRVRACNDCSCSDWKIMYVTHRYIQSGGNGPGFDFGLHPNPNTGIFNFSLVPNSDFSFHSTTIQMYDVNSRMRHQQSIKIGTENIIEVPHLEAGYYLLRVDLQNGEYQNININIVK